MPGTLLEVIDWQVAELIVDYWSDAEHLLLTTAPHFLSLGSLGTSKSLPPRTPLQKDVK